MLSKNQTKLITSLAQKKYRKEFQLFFAEGKKIIKELIAANYELVHLYTTKEHFSDISDSIKHKIEEVTLKKISALTTPNDCLAVFKIPPPNNILEKGLLVALEDIRDPGNLGTIIRLCDWFGITQVICSNQTVDIYNPKVVQATMGSLARVQVNYLDLEEYFQKTALPIFGTFLEGENIYKTNLPLEGIIVLGNEANGISKTIENLITQKISIPRFGNLQQTESLNVATATAIVLSEFKRKEY